MSSRSSPEVLINIDVDDLARAVEFYTKGLGLEAVRRLGDGFELVGGAAKIYLLEKKEGSAAYGRDDAPRRAYRRHWTPVHLDFVADDLEAAVERACAAGAVLERPPSTHAWGRMALLADPFGNGFCVLQFSERGYDALVE